MVTCYNNSITSVIPQVRSGKGGVYVALLLPREGREAVSRRPPAQVTHMVVTRMLH